MGVNNIAIDFTGLTVEQKNEFFRQNWHLKLISAVSDITGTETAYFEVMNMATPSNRAEPVGYNDPSIEPATEPVAA